MQQVCLNLGVAFNNFFEKRAKYPKFKSRHGKQSIQYLQNVKIADNQLILPKIGKVSAIIHRDIEGKIKTVTITKNCSDQYFAAILFEDGKETINHKDERLRMLRPRLVLSEVEVSVQVFNLSEAEGLTSGTGDNACRPEVSRSNRGRKNSTTVLSAGQEANTVPSGQCG